MSQSPTARSSLGIGFVTSMSRPDAALALALLHGQALRPARVGSICVGGAGLGAATFCDMVRQFYTGGPATNTNTTLPIGLAATVPLPPDPSMVRAVLDRRNAQGEPQYPHIVRRVSDTSQAEAVLRNGVTQTTDAAIVLSAPATSLARTLALPGVRDLFATRVRRLVVVDTGASHADVPALRSVIADWPSPVFLCGPDVGEAVPFPGASIDRDFGWTDAHPVVDAYRAFQSMPYDAPSSDLVAVHFAAHPDAGLFDLSEPGALSVTDEGRLRFARGGGRVRALQVDPARRAQVVQTLVEAVSAQPAARR